MPRRRRSRRTLTTLVVLVLISVTVISLDESGKAQTLTSGARSVATDAFSPLRAGVNAVLDPIGRFFAGAAHYGALEQENEKLRAQIGALRQQMAGSSFERQQYQALEQLLALHKLPALSSLPMVLAESASVSTSNFAATITIDKGRGAGVAVGDPVVGAGGLVGQVVQASHTTATVRLVTDGQSKVGVAYGTGGKELATLDGQGAGKALSADFVPATTAVRQGEVMVTDGLQGAEFPAGIPVATVASVRTTAGATDKLVTAEPIADLHALTYVAVVQWAPAP